MIHATDTDVVVIAIAVSSVLHGGDIRIAFVDGTKKRYIQCHFISQVLGSGCHAENELYSIDIP